LNVFIDKLQSLNCIRIVSWVSKRGEIGHTRPVCREFDIPAVDKQIMCKTRMIYRRFVS